MNEGTKQGIQIKIERFHLSVRLQSLFFPVELSELVPILEESQYKVRSELAERLRDVPLGTKIVWGGSIAEKRDVGHSFRMEPERGVMAIVGQDIDAIVEDFLSIENLINENLSLVLEKQARFYEFIAEGTATTGKDPTRVIAKILNGTRLQPEISKILGYSVTNFGLRFVEQNRYVTDTQWLDFKIEPLVPKPDTTYSITVIYRHPEREKVLQAARSLKATAEKVISTIERETEHGN